MKYQKSWASCVANTPEKQETTKVRNIICIIDIIGIIDIIY